MFSDANISAEKGTELLQALGMDALDVQKPDMFQKFMDIAKYVGKFGDGVRIARIVSHGTEKAERLSKMWEYVSLRKSLDEVRKEKSVLETSDLITDQEKLKGLEAQEHNLLNEIQLYE